MARGLIVPGFSSRTPIAMGLLVPEFSSYVPISRDLSIADFLHTYQPVGISSLYTCLHSCQSVHRDFLIAVFSVEGGQE